MYILYCTVYHDNIVFTNKRILIYQVAKKIASRNLSWWLSHLDMYNTERTLIFILLICDVP